MIDPIKLAPFLLLAAVWTAVYYRLKERAQFLPEWNEPSYRLMLRLWPLAPLVYVVLVVKEAIRSRLMVRRLRKVHALLDEIRRDGSMSKEDEEEFKEMLDRFGAAIDDFEDDDE